MINKIFAVEVINITTLVNKVLIGFGSHFLVKGLVNITTKKV